MLSLTKVGGGVGASSITQTVVHLLCAGGLSPDAGQGSAHLFGFTQARREGVPRQFELLRRSVKHRNSDRPGRHGQRKGEFDTRL